MDKTCINCRYCEDAGIGALFCKGKKYMPRVRADERCDDWKARYKTRGDAVREMTNEQLAVMLAKLRGKPWVLALDVTMYSEYDVDEWREWLETEVK